MGLANGTSRRTTTITRLARAASGHWGVASSASTAFSGAKPTSGTPCSFKDNQSIDQPYLPEQGYHFSKDITDKALQYIRDGRASDPDKPWFMYFAPGCGHAPHQVPKEWADKYKGKFDMGYEKYREQVLARQIEMGIIPKGTELTPLNPYVGEAGRGWQAVAARRHRASVGFVERRREEAVLPHGRGVRGLRLTLRLISSADCSTTWRRPVTSTIRSSWSIADNGASGEGGPNGTVNEMKFFNGVVDTVQDSLKYIDELGSPKTYNHYCNGWAEAFCTPFKMYKRYANYEGGTADPLLIAWPKGIKARGEIRHQYCHVIDIVPTLYECSGIEPPDVVHGYTQSEIEGVSIAHTFDNAEAPTKKQAQFYTMLGTRGIWMDGWHASTVHPAMGGWGDFEQDRWELFNLEQDRSQSKRLATEHPEKVELAQGPVGHARGSLPGPAARRSHGRRGFLDSAPAARQAAQPVRVLPGLRAGAPGRERQHRRSAPSRSRPTSTMQDGQVEGVMFAQGSDTGGHTLYVKGGPAQLRLQLARRDAAEGLFAQAARAGQARARRELRGARSTTLRQESGGPGTLVHRWHGGGVRGDQDPARILRPRRCRHGRSRHRQASDGRLRVPDTFRGGVVEKVTVKVMGQPHRDPETEAKMALSRD